MFLLKHPHKFTTPDELLAFLDFLDGPRNRETWLKKRKLSSLIGQFRGYRGDRSSP